MTEKIRESRLRPGLITPYIWSAAAVGIASLINLVHQRQGLDGDAHYFTLIAAVFFAALYGGLGPGLMATALAALSSTYFSLAPLFSIQIESKEAAQRLSLFVGEGVLATVMAYLVREDQRREGPLRWYFRYLIIPLPVIAAALLKMVLDPRLAQEFPFAFNYAAICLSAWLGGAGGGIVATVVAALVTRYWFLAPVHSLAVRSEVEVLRLILFAGEGVLISLVSGKHLQFQRALKKMSARARDHLASAQSALDDIRAVRAISRDTIWEWDIEHGEISRTPSWQDIISASLPEREDFEAWVNRIHPEDRDATVVKLSTALSKGREDCQYNYRLAASNGGYISVSDHAFVVRDQNWRVLRVVGRSAELPGQPRRRPPLPFDELRFTRMFEDSPLAALIVEPDLRIVFANASARGMLRTRGTALVSADLGNFVADGIRARLVDRLAPLFAWEKLTVRFEESLKRPPAESFRATFHAALVSGFYPDSTGCLIWLEEPAA